MFDFYFLAEESEDGFFLTEQPRKKSKTPSKLPPTSPKDGRKSPILTQIKDAAVAEQQQQLTTQSQAGDTDSKKHEKEKHQWDEYLLSILSRPTAQWIVTQRTDPGDKRYKVRPKVPVC